MLTYFTVSTLFFVWGMVMCLAHGDAFQKGWKNLTVCVLLVAICSLLWWVIMIWHLCDTIGDVRQQLKNEGKRK
jgi:hypothetical protein